MARHGNPRTFYWQYQDSPSAATEVGHDGFLPVPATENPQITMEVTLRFEGKHLKGYSDVFDVEERSAPTEVILDGCLTDDFFT